jgi:hypothetical protein
MELRRLLQTTIRGGQSCNDYFERMRSIADQLVAVGRIVTDSDLTRYVLNGLGSDPLSIANQLAAFVVAITTRSSLRNFMCFSFLTKHYSTLNISRHLHLSRLHSMHRVVGETDI